MTGQDGFKQHLVCGAIAFKHLDGDSQIPNGLILGLGLLILYFYHCQYPLGNRVHLMAILRMSSLIRMLWKWLTGPMRPRISLMELVLILKRDMRNGGRSSSWQVREALTSACPQAPSAVLVSISNNAFENNVMHLFILGDWHDP